MYFFTSDKQPHKASAQRAAVSGKYTSAEFCFDIAFYLFSFLGHCGKNCIRLIFVKAVV